MIRRKYFFYCFHFTDLQVAQNVETGSEAACDGDVDDVADLEEAGVSLSISIK